MEFDQWMNGINHSSSTFSGRARELLHWYLLYSMSQWFERDGIWYMYLNISQFEQTSCHQFSPDALSFMTHLNAAPTTTAKWLFRFFSTSRFQMLKSSSKDWSWMNEKGKCSNCGKNLSLSDRRAGRPPRYAMSGSRRQRLRICEHEEVASAIFESISAKSIDKWAENIALPAFI
jgi:hypothetical protein